MKITSITIDGLFDEFDYEIKFPEGEDILIITGPNGFGKTQILNIIYNLFNENTLYFQKLTFNEIIVFLSNSYTIEIKKAVTADSQILITIKGNENSTVFLNNSLNISELPHDITTDDPGKKANSTLNNIKIHFIQEQRLLKKINSNGKNKDSNQKLVIETIKTYSKDIREKTALKKEESHKISQELDSSYPTRLITEKNTINKENYEKRFTAIIHKQKKLVSLGLYEKEQEVLEYSKADAKALLVYLNDLEKKLNVYDNLLNKLELFAKILNERRFTFKTIHFSNKHGLHFKTSKGKAMSLDLLSSGEQQEVVLWYELIFNTQNNNLVLIDEPEISLHVTWQKEFLKDLLKIMEFQKFQVIIATHSPAIINDRWDLVHNLEKVHS